jgi:hypothetical protein
MRKLFTIWLTGAFFPLYGQVSYITHPQTITSKSPIRVEWVSYSTFNQTVSINKKISFVNTKEDRINNTIVRANLIKQNKDKKELIKRFVCPVGDGIITPLNAELITLDVGEILYFDFTLVTNDTEEEYVFNIFDKITKPVDKEIEKPQQPKPDIYYIKPKKRITGYDPAEYAERFGKKKKKSKILSAII